MKKIVSSFAIAALMTFGFADSSIAQEGGSSNVATQAQEGKTKADTPEEAVELDFVQTLKQKYNCHNFLLEDLFLVIQNL